MAVPFFGELVAVKKIKYEGSSVHFFIDEKFAGFLFEKHKIADLIVPTEKVDVKLLSLLREAPNNELYDVEMVLEGRATDISKLNKQ